MPLPSLSGSNIQDTYQRVLHTNGTDFYDGTGSVIRIAELETGVSFTNLNISGSITASGNISSSGNLYFNIMDGGTF